MLKEKCCNIHTRAIIDSLRTSPLLVSSLTEAVCFDRAKFSKIGEIPDIDYAQKLGHLYEDMLEHLITSSPGIDLLGRGVQIFDQNKITLGELDYILRDTSTGESIHLELAVKFYLISYQDGKPTYPGPDPRDNWLNKLQRLRVHQLRMTQSIAGKKLLLDDYGISQITPQQLIYGKLFDHYQAADRPLPPAINASCERGVWKHLHEWCLDSDDKIITLIPKHLWQVNVNDLLHTLPSISREDFIVEATQRCCMIWDPSSITSQFIAPDTWG